MSIVAATPIVDLKLTIVGVGEVLGPLVLIAGKGLFPRAETDGRF